MRGTVSISLGLAAGLLLALSGCGNLPRPFEPTAETVIPLPASPSTLGISVLAHPDLGSTEAAHLSEEIAAALRQAEIPAEAVTGIGRLGYRLEGVRGATAERPNLAWQLSQRDGPVVETFNQEFPGGLTPDASTPDEVWQALAEDLSSKIVASLGPAAQSVIQPLRAGEGLRVRIAPPETAPGDGAAALTRILANRLTREGFAPAEEAPELTFVGRVIIESYDRTQDDIAIIWQVVDNQGADLGEVRLDNRIPKGELDGAWGLIAEAIVDSAFPGLMEIVVSYRQSRNQ